MFVESHKSGEPMQLKDIAAKLDVSADQVRKWKREDKKKGVDWDAMANGHVTNGFNSHVTIPSEKQRRRGGQIGNQNARGHGAPAGNQNALGNDGGAPEGNDNAVSHGLYRQRIKGRLPAKIANLMDDLRGMPPLDVIYEAILFDFAKLIEGMELLHVDSQEAHLTLIKKKKSDYVPSGKGDEFRMQEVVTEIEFEHHAAPVLQANAMKAFAVVQNSLRANIKLFMEMSGEDDKRRLELQQMRLQIEKSEAELEQIKAGSAGGKEGLRLEVDYGDGEE